MPVSKNPNAYIYTKPVLDAALANGSVTYQLNTPSEAMKFRAHANAYKRMCSMSGPTDYDKLEIILKRDCLVIKVKDLKGKLFLTNNREAVIDLAIPEPPDPLLDFAQGLAKKLPDGDDLDI